MQTAAFSHAVSYDFLTLICGEMTTLKQLGVLATVNKPFRNFLRSKAGGMLWMAIGRRVCGDRYWPDIDAYTPNANDGAYITRIRVCPWLSRCVPTVIDAMQSVVKLGGICDVAEMFLDDGNLGFHLKVEPYDGVVFTDPKEFAVVMPARPMDWDRTQETEDLNDVTFPNVVLKESEIAYCEQAKVKFANSKYFQPISNVRRAYLVHEGVVGIMFACDKTANLLFCDTKDLRVLRNMSVYPSDIKGDKPCVFFRPGEMWVLDSEECAINYYGPSVNKRPCDLDVRGLVDPAFAAVCEGRAEDAVAIMRKIGAPLTMFGNFKDWNLMHYAAYVGGDVKTVRYLAEAGMDVNSLAGDEGGHWRLPPLSMAGAQCNIATMTQLIKVGANVNLRPFFSDSTTLLHVAIENKWEVPAVLVLVSKGADVNARCMKSGQTPLFYVADIISNGGLSKARDYVNILLAAGADVNAESKDSTVLGHWVQTVVSLTSLNPMCSDCLGIIIESGCNVNAQYGIKKRTALMDAVRRYNKPMIWALVDLYYADVTIADADGKTALMHLDEKVKKISEGRVSIDSTESSLAKPETLVIDKREMDDTRRLLGAKI